MPTVGEWIRDRRKLLGLRREDLIAPTSLSLATLARIENDGGPSNRTSVIAVARALKLDEDASAALADWHAGTISKDQFLARYNGTGPLGGRSIEGFLRDRGLEPPPRKMLPTLPKIDFFVTEPGAGTPILGEVTAGGLVESIVFDEGESPERIPIHYPNKARVYALRVRGDSMSPEFRAGEILIVQDAMKEELVDGKDTVIQCDGSRDGGSTFKRVFLMGEDRLKLVPLNSAYPTQECRLSSVARIGKVLGVYRPL